MDNESACRIAASATRKRRARVKQQDQQRLWSVCAVEKKARFAIDGRQEESRAGGEDRCCNEGVLKSECSEKI